MRLFITGSRVATAATVRRTGSWFVVLVLTFCHGWIHGNPAEAERAGYIVSGLVDPSKIRDIPVWSTFWQSSILLNPDYTITLYIPEVPDGETT
jgi:hypothetical protein